MAVLQSKFTKQITVKFGIVWGILSNFPFYFVSICNKCNLTHIENYLIIINIQIIIIIYINESS